MNKKILSVLLVVILGVTSLVGCSNGGSNESEIGNASNENGSEVSIKDQLVFIAKAKTETLDPLTRQVLNKTVMHSIFDCLVKYGPDAKIIPSLAESWVDDGMAVTFKLREDVVFHDGSKFTADDVIFSLDTMGASPEFAWITRYIAGWEKVDDYNVKILKPNSFTQLLNILTEYSYVVSQEAYENDPEGFAENPIGTGAYKFVSKGIDDSVVLVANEDYFEGRPEITNVIIKSPVDSSTKVIALETGEADVVMDVPIAQIPIIEGSENLEFVESESWGMNELALMGSKFDDKNFTKAIKHAINRENVILLSNEGIGEPAKDLYSSRIMGDLAGIVKYEGYNIEKAKEYLAMSNYDADTKLTLSIDAQYIDMAQAIQADLSQIGVNIEIEQLEYNTFWDRIYGAEIEMAIFSGGSPMVGIEDSLLISTSEPWKSTMSASDEKKVILSEILIETDKEVRKELVLEALELEIDQSNFVAIYENTMNFAHTDKITNINPVSAATQVFYIGDFKVVE